MVLACVSGCLEPPPEQTPGEATWEAVKGGTPPSVKRLARLLTGQGAADSTPDYKCLTECFTRGAGAAILRDIAFTPNYIEVASGSTLTFDFQEIPYTVMTVSTTMGAPGISINNGGGNSDAESPVPQQRGVTITGLPGAEINYQCGIHLAAMQGKIKGRLTDRG